MADQLRHFLVHLDQGVGELHRVAGGVADAVDAVDIADQQNQVGQIQRLAAGALAPVGVHVLAQQVDFAHAHVRQVADLIQHRLHRAAHFLAPGVGHHAEGAVLGAAFHDRHEGAGAVHAGLGQVVELFDFREGHIDGQRAGAGRLGDQARQAVQGLGAEHHVHIGGALADRLAFLAGHAAADADDQLRVALLEALPAAQLVEHLFLGFFADRAGVEQQHIRVFRIVRGFQIVGGLQQIDHAGGVVLVHLAAVGLDKEFLGHGNVLGAGKRGDYTHICFCINTRPVVPCRFRKK